MRPVSATAFYVGLTGPIGAGKSLVAECWRQFGAQIISGDDMGRLALETDTLLRKSLANRYGADILDESGQVIRSKLAQAAFQSPEAQRDLTTLTFPALYSLAWAHLAAANSKIVVFDAALIFEWGVQNDFNKIVVVTAPEDLLIKRACGRLNISPGEAKNRLVTQISPEVKQQRADYVIVNDGSVGELNSRAEDVWKLLEESLTS